MDREYCFYDTWSLKFVKACFIAWHMINIFVICVLENNLGSLITEWNFFTVDNFNESRKYIILSFFVLKNWFYTHKIIPFTIIWYSPIFFSCFPCVPNFCDHILFIYHATFNINQCLNMLGRSLCYLFWPTDTLHTNIILFCVLYLYSSF